MAGNTMRYNLFFFFFFPMVSFIQSVIEAPSYELHMQIPAHVVGQAVECSVSCR